MINAPDGRRQKAWEPALERVPVRVRLNACSDWTDLSLCPNTLLRWGYLHYTVQRPWVVQAALHGGWSQP